MLFDEFSELINVQFKTKKKQKHVNKINIECSFYSINSILPLLMKSITQHCFKFVTVIELTQTESIFIFILNVTIKKPVFFLGR